MTEKEIKQHLKASRELRRELRASPKAARRFLVRAGILDKSGKRLANPCKG
jgi:hypothetical protein